MYEATEATERELHRSPTGDVPGLPGVMLRALTNVLRGTAAIITGLLSYARGTADTYRVGMPEALLIALRECGDREAARLAAERFLEQFPRVDGRQAAPFGYCRGYFIEERRDAGGGWYVLQRRGGENVMPGGEWFGSTDAAALIIDRLYENGLMVDDGFINTALKFAVRGAAAA